MWPSYNNKILSIFQLLLPGASQALRMRTLISMTFPPLLDFFWFLRLICTPGQWQEKLCCLPRSPLKPHRQISNTGLTIPVSVPEIPSAFWHPDHTVPPPKGRRKTPRTPRRTFTGGCEGPARWERRPSHHFTTYSPQGKPLHIFIVDKQIEGFADGVYKQKCALYLLS